VTLWLLARPLVYAVVAGVALGAIVGAVDAIINGGRS
jgi:hypothetical protein